MGDGCINIPEIRGWVEDAEFFGYNEVEIFPINTGRWIKMSILKKLKTYLKFT
jgi:hypothetical protein